MNVTFASFGAHIASSRLRAVVPQREVGKLGIGKGSDVLIYGKHLLEKRHVQGFKKLVFDVCDDHFDNPELGKYYREHIGMADLVTCNSEVMQKRIKEVTGRDSVMVREPYESEENAPDIGPLLLWFGHASNVVDYERIEPELAYQTMVLSNHPDYAQWSQESFLEAISTPCVVIIPTGKSMAKSENRMVESIRCGRYVCAEYLPSYKPFDQFFPLGSIPEHVEDVLDNPDEAISRIRQAQDYIRTLYSPESIGMEWYEILRGLQ